MSEAPEFYREVKVPEVRKRYWDKPTMRAWREGVDSTLIMLLFAAKKAHKELQDTEPLYYLSEWAEGSRYGREDELEMLIDKLAALLNEGNISLASLEDGND